MENITLTLTKEKLGLLINHFEELLEHRGGRWEDVPDCQATMRFYDSLGDTSWYAVEFDQDSHHYGFFFGLVVGAERERVTFTLKEILDINEAAGFERVKFDPHFEPTYCSLIPRK